MAYDEGRLVILNNTYCSLETLHPHTLSDHYCDFTPFIRLCKASSVAISAAI